MELFAVQVYSFYCYYLLLQNKYLRQCLFYNNICVFTHWNTNTNTHQRTHIILYKETVF